MNLDLIIDPFHSQSKKKTNLEPHLNLNKKQNALPSAITRNTHPGQVGKIFGQYMSVLQSSVYEESWKLQYPSDMTEPERIFGEEGQNCIANLAWRIQDYIYF